MPPPFPYPAMTTKTDLANYALAHIGLQRITDITDTDSPTAVVCNEFVDQVIDEVIRSHPWNCTVKMETLSEISGDPGFGWSNQFQMPGDVIRLLEVNGKDFGNSDELYEIKNGKVLLTDYSTMEIRYAARIDVNDMDPLLAEACALKLASKIIAPLSANLNLQQQVAVMYERVLSRAKQCDAVESGSRQNRPIDRMFQQSILQRSRYWSGLSPYAYGRYYVPWI
jgi:hypothetical protein